MIKVKPIMKKNILGIHPRILINLNKHSIFNIPIYYLYIIMKEYIVFFKYENKYFYFLVFIKNGNI